MSAREVLAWPVVGLGQFLSQGSVGTESFLVARRVDMSRSSERLLQGDLPSFKAPRAVLHAPGWYQSMLLTEGAGSSISHLKC